MKTVRNLPLSGLLALSLSACSPALVPSSPLAPAGTDAAPTASHRANVGIRIVNPAGRHMGIQATAGQTRLDHYTVTLKQGATTVGTPKNVAATLVTFTDTVLSITNGNGYTIKVDAQDSSNASLLTSVGTTIAFDVANGQVFDAVGDPTHTTPLNTTTSPLAVAITFVDATTTNPGPTVNVTGGAANQSMGLSLLNKATRKAAGAAAKSVASGSENFLITNVLEGDTGGLSHQLWSYCVDTVTGQATVAQPLDVVGNGSGLISTTQIDLIFSMGQPAAAPGGTTTARLIADGQSEGYYFAPDGLFHKADGSNASSPFDPGTNPAPNVTTYTVKPTGEFYAFNAEDNKIVQVQAPMGGTPNTVVALAGAISELCIDGSGALYWVDGGAVKRLPSGGTNGDITTPIASGVTNMAVDAFGNIYYGTATNIYRAERKNDGSYTGTGATSPVVTGTAISSLVADLAGNLYFVDGTGNGNLKMRAHSNGTTVYKVTGAATMEAKKVAVGADGHLYFTDAVDAIQKI